MLKLHLESIQISNKKELHLSAFLITLDKSLIIFNIYSEGIPIAIDNKLL